MTQAFKAAIVRARHDGIADSFSDDCETSQCLMSMRHCDWRTRWRIVGVLMLSLLTGTAIAADPLYAFGPDANGVGRVLSRIASSAPGVALGDGTVAFNGGLTYFASDQRFYAIQNDASGNSALTSFTAAAPTTLATPRALGMGFYGGLAADSGHSTLYAVASNAVGASTLYRVDPATGATALAALGVGYYGGLAFDSADGDLYAIGADDFGVQRRVSRIDLDAAGGPSVSTLFDLGDSSLAFQGGLAFDASMQRFVVIGNDRFARSSLYAFSTAGAASLVDLATPVGVGFVNAGLAFAPSVPEPSSALLFAAALPLLWLFLRGGAHGHRFALPRQPQPRTRTMMRRPTLAHALTALLALAAGSASAQYSTPMRDVENPDRSPFMLKANGFLEAPFVNAFLFFPTPAGRRYFIDYVSLTCTTPNAADTFTQILLGASQNMTTGGSIPYSTPAIVMERRGPQPGGNGAVWTGAANVKMFSDPDPTKLDGGTNISMQIYHTDPSSRASCSGYVYGHSVAP